MRALRPRRALLLRSELITRPRMLRLLLMLLASRSRSPLAPLAFCCSLPAKSTRLSRLVSTVVMPSRTVSLRMTQVRTQCERLDSRFMRVSPMCRLRVP